MLTEKLLLCIADIYLIPFSIDIDCKAHFQTVYNHQFTDGRSDESENFPSIKTLRVTWVFHDITLELEIIFTHTI